VQFAHIIMLKVVISVTLQSTLSNECPFLSLFTHFY